MDLPETRYAKSGDMRIAYQVVGERAVRSGLRPRLRLQSRSELGRARAGLFLLAARRFLAADPVRQARHRPLRPQCRHRQPRRSDGRRPGRDGRGRAASAPRYSASRKAAPMSMLFAATYPRANPRPCPLWHLCAPSAAFGGRRPQAQDRIDRACLGHRRVRVRPVRPGQGRRRRCSFGASRAAGNARAPARRPRSRCMQMNQRNRCAPYSSDHPGADAGPSSGR